MSRDEVVVALSFVAVKRVALPKVFINITLVVDSVMYPLSLMPYRPVQEIHPLVPIRSVITL